MIERIRGALARHRNLWLLLAALCCGAIAVLAGHGYLAGRLEAERARLAPKPVAMADVVVARRDLGKGDPVGPETMALRRIPLEYVSASVIRPDQFDGFNGTRLAYPLRSGEQLVAGAVVGGEQLAFSSRVKPGIRALTIAVDEINSISGMLQPGDRIDLLFSARPPETGRGSVPESTVPLFQNLLVLATGRQVRPGVDERGAQRSFSTVTVEVEPEPAQRLVVAQRAGKLTAVLRNPDDHGRLARRSMDVRELLDLPPAKPVTGRRPPQVIIGGVGRAPGYSALPAPTPQATAGLAAIRPEPVPPAPAPVPPDPLRPVAGAGFAQDTPDAPRRQRP